MDFLRGVKMKDGQNNIQLNINAATANLRHPPKIDRSPVRTREWKEFLPQAKLGSLTSLIMMFSGLALLAMYSGVL